MKTFLARVRTFSTAIFTALAVTLATIGGGLSDSGFVGFTSEALAEPSARLTSGDTAVTLSTDFKQAVGSLAIGVSLVNPGRQRSGLITFPIRTGQLDTETLRGEILHEGGLRLSNANAAVDLLNFTIDTTGSVPVLTGLLRLNNSIVGRLPLFALTIRDPMVTRFGRFLNLANVALSLRPEAAAALNTFFQTTAFTAGFNVGSATVASRLNFSSSTRALR